ncbi:DUF4277 domain-containing protein [Microcoleus sp. MOSTC5]
MNQPLSGINIVNLDHLGIVGGIIDEMELVEEVNKKVGIKTKETVSPGQVMGSAKQVMMHYNDG